jgi:hypothetical protein
VLFSWKIHTGNTCHFILLLTLSLFVTRVLANNPNNAATTYDFALVANFFY